MAAVFVTDLSTPMGIAVWALYLVPVVLSYLTWHPSSPMAVAAAATVLTLIGYFLSPMGADPGFSGINRSIAIATAWALAVFGFQFIRNKLAVREQEWIQSLCNGIDAGLNEPPDIVRDCSDRHDEVPSRSE
ncbi:MAG: hypothetical protein ACXW39_09670 [Nitrospira sp.]